MVMFMTFLFIYHHIYKVSLNACFMRVSCTLNRMSHSKIANLAGSLNEGVSLDVRGVLSS